MAHFSKRSINILILENNLIILPCREEVSPHQHSDRWEQLSVFAGVCGRETDRQWREREGESTWVCVTQDLGIVWVSVWVEGVVCGGAGDFSLQDSRLDLGGGLWDAHY